MCRGAYTHTHYSLVALYTIASNLQTLDDSNHSAYTRRGNDRDNDDKNDEDENDEGVVMVRQRRSYFRTTTVASTPPLSSG